MLFRHSSNGIHSYRWAWRAALALFVVAGGTGAFFRLASVYGWTGGLDLGNVRHAHSHLMYFGWGTPALMALIWNLLPTEATGSRQRAFRWVVGGTTVAAVVAYPLFLLFGYSPVQIGSARLPIAVVGASLNIVGWYGFVVLYVAATRELDRTAALRLWDLAVLALVLATFGAWGLSLIQPLGLQNPLVATALTHVFLDLFSEGWFVLGVLGVAFATIERTRGEPSEWPIWLIGLGLPLTFILALPKASLSVAMEMAGRVGGSVVGVCLLVLALRLFRRLAPGPGRWLWGVPLGCLALKASAQVMASVMPTLWLGTSQPFRILYLHLMLLGFFSLGLVAAAQTVWQANRLPYVSIFQGAVISVLISIGLLLPWGPAGGYGVHVLAAWVALLPVLAALGLLLDDIRDGNARRSATVEPARDGRALST